MKGFKIGLLLILFVVLITNWLITGCNQSNYDSAESERLKLYEEVRNIGSGQSIEKNKETFEKFRNARESGFISKDADEALKDYRNLKRKYGN